MNPVAWRPGHPRRRREGQRQRLARAAILSAALLAASSAPAAEPARIVLGEATIVFDPSSWTVSGVTADGVRFTCVADNCSGSPAVLLSRATEPGSLCLARESRGADTTPLPLAPGPGAGPALRVFSRWSGCRARDEPILEACAEHRGAVYTFTSGPPAGGCNFGPEMPEARFLELVGGLSFGGPAR